MDIKESDKIAAFDTLYTNNHIQMMKIILPLLDKSMRLKMAVYIKFLEFQHTLKLAGNPSFAYGLSSAEQETVDFSALCDELLPYCDEAERARISQFKNISSMIAQYKEISSMMSMFKDMFPDSGSAEGGSESGAASSPFGDMAFSPEMLLNFLSPDQQQLFSMFQNKEDE